jgi:hypothetical protein
MMRIDVEEVRKLRERLNEINAVPLAEIEWCEGGELITPPDGAIEEWRFMGLSNDQFVMLGWYADGPGGPRDPLVRAM